MTDDERHSDERQHAVMIIDMPAATADEVQAVFRAVRECAAQSDDVKWPEDFAVLVGAPAVDISERVRDAIESARQGVSA
jgi:hypothetical protein